MAYRMMCITAHPDDESGAFGGALLAARAIDVETTVICLTEGQAASHRGESSSGEELAEMRRAEFAAACEVLGVARGEVLHYPDGKLANHDPSVLIGALVERIRQWRPQVVLTFGGEGGVNLHRDHTVASLSTTAAFHWAGRLSAFPEQIDRGMKPYWPQKLYYSSTPFLVAGSEEEKANTALTPYSLALELDDLAVEKKSAAFRKHTSQAVLLEKHKEFWEKAARTERYLLVAARKFQQSGEDNSLFQDVIEY